MNVKILAHRDAIPEVVSHSNHYNVVLITNPENPFHRPDLHDLVKHAKECLICKFIDVEYGMYDPSSTRWHDGPQRTHIEEILKFAEGKDNLICTCHAGMSRSAAVAFVILCKYQEPEEAVKILQVPKHDPNSIVIKHGAEVLNKPEMVPIITEYKQQVKRAMYHW